MLALANRRDAGVTLDDGSAEPAFRAGYARKCRAINATADVSWN